MIKSVSLGMPRIGRDAELPKIVADFISKAVSFSDVEQVGKKIRLQNIKTQKESGIDFIPTNDFSFYDHILDTTCLIGNIPRRFFWEGGAVPTSIYFTMITGQQKDRFDIIPLGLQHFGNTNYKYLVHEFTDPVDLSYSSNKPIVDFLEAKTEYKTTTRPVLVGPLAYFTLGKLIDQELTRFEVLSEIVNVYLDVISNFIRIGVKDIQIDEYFLSTELTLLEQEDCIYVYKKIASICDGKINIHITVGDNSIKNNIDFISELPVKSIHINLKKNIEHIKYITKKISNNTCISLGAIDSSNIFANNLSQSIEMVSRVLDTIESDRVYIGPTSSLFLCPYSTEKEEKKFRNFSFAKEKLEEINIIKNAINSSESKYTDIIKNNKELFESKKESIVVPELELKTDKNQETIQQNDHILPTFSTMLVGYFDFNESLVEKKKIKNLNESELKEVNNISIQEKIGIDIISSGTPYSLDIFEFYIKNISGLQTLNSFIQISGVEYFSPSFISSTKDLISEQKNISKIIASNELKFALMTKKPFKITIPGPISISNRIFLNHNDIDRIDLQRIFVNIIDGILSGFDEVKNIKAIEFNEEDIMVNLDTKNLAKFTSELDKINNIFKGLMAKIKNHFNDISPMIYLSDYNFTDYIEELMKIQGYGILFSSCKSRHAILENFISYKHDRIIGIGVVDSSDLRIPTTNQIMNEIKKVNMHLDERYTILMPDSGFKNKNQQYAIKTLQNFMIAVKKYREKLKEEN